MHRRTIRSASTLATLAFVLGCSGSSEDEVEASAGASGVTESTGGAGSDEVGNGGMPPSAGGATWATGGAPPAGGGATSDATGGSDSSPGTGGTAPAAGGASPGTGGIDPGTGGMSPGIGGTDFGTGGTDPGTGGTDPGTGGTDPGTGGTDPGTGGTDPGTGGTDPGTGGTEPGTGGTDPGTGGTEPGTGGTDPATGGTEPGTGGTDPGTGGAGGDPGVGAEPTALPTPTSSCPELVSGMLTILGKDVSLSVGPAGTPGPVLFYWHATGMTYTEVNSGFSDAMADVEANGGVVASFTTTNGQGTNTGNGVWYTGDIDVADEVLACALEQGLVDTRRIHVSGYSAGGLQCAAMSYLRSGYVASVLCMSGGFVSGLSTYSLQDPAHIPAAIAAHGAAGSDVFILDFATCSENYCADVVSHGGLAIDCNDGGDHIGSMTSRASTMGAVAWQFFAENPYGAAQTYPSGLPTYFPSYCAIVE